MSDNYRKRAFWESIKRSREGSGMRVGMPQIDAAMAEGYVSELEAENTRLQLLLGAEVSESGRTIVRLQDDIGRLRASLARQQEGKADG